jgi:hypothetical protein
MTLHHPEGLEVVASGLTPIEAALDSREGGPLMETRFDNAGPVIG